NKLNSVDGLYPYCITCAVKKSSVLQKENRETYYEHHKKYRKTDKYKKWGRKHGEEQRKSGYSSDYRKSNPDKMKLYSSMHRKHDISKNEWSNCLKVFNYRCAYCGMSQDDSVIKYKKRLHMEHVDHEGYNDLRNAVPACTGCNSSKYI